MIHRFQSDLTLGEPEKKSQELLHRIFICLRIVKPTRTRSTAIQLRWTEKGEVDVFSFTYPETTIANIPDAEVLNVVTREDLKQLKRLLPVFLSVADDGPFFLRRATRCYEQGYSETRDPVLQFLLWMMGIEAILRKGEEDARDSLAELLRRMPPELDIYSEASAEHYTSWPRVTVSSVANDLFRLRDTFIHGAYIPDEWRTKSFRKSVAGEPLVYADVLRDAASFILRQLIRNSLQSLTA